MDVPIKAARQRWGILRLLPQEVYPRYSGSHLYTGGESKAQALIPSGKIGLTRIIFQHTGAQHDRQLLCHSLFDRTESGKDQRESDSWAQCPMANGATAFDMHFQQHDHLQHNTCYHNVGRFRGSSANRIHQRQGTCVFAMAFFLLHERDCTQIASGIAVSAESCKLTVLWEHK